MPDNRKRLITKSESCNPLPARSLQGVDLSYPTLDIAWRSVL